MNSAARHIYRVQMSGITSVLSEFISSIFLAICLYYSNAQTTIQIMHTHRLEKKNAMITTCKIETTAS